MLGVFEALHERPSSAAELAERLGLDPAGSGDARHRACRPSDTWRTAGTGGSRNAPVTERLLVRSSPDRSRPSWASRRDLHWQVLDMLPDAVRSGRPVRDARGAPRRDAERWEAYIRGLFEISRAEHDANAALVPVEDPRRLVDVAGGPRRLLDGDVPPPSGPRGHGARPAAERRGGARGSWRRRATRTGSRFREGDVFEHRSGGGPRRRRRSSTWSTTCPRSATASSCRMAHDALRPGRLPRGRRLGAGPSRASRSRSTARSRACCSTPGATAATSSRPRSAAGWRTRASPTSTLHRNERSPWRVVVVGRR